MPDGYNDARTELAQEFGFVAKSNDAETAGETTDEALNKSADRIAGGKWFETAEGTEGDVQKGAQAAAEAKASDAQEGEGGPKAEATESMEAPAAKSNESDVSGWKPGTTLGELFKSNLGDETLKLYEGEAVINDIVKGFISISENLQSELGNTQGEVTQLRAIVKAQGDMLSEALPLVMRAMVEMHRENKALHKAIENLPVHQAPLGVRASAGVEAEAQPVTKAWAVKAADGSEQINYDVLGDMVAKAIENPQTDAEKLLVGAHLQVRKGGYRKLPKEYRAQIGLPLE